MSAPIDLSTVPGYSRALSSRIYVTAFIGRCSTKDNQDPRTSIPGQASVCAARLGKGEQFDAYFWDVESGYTELDSRGLHSDEYYTDLQVPLRRDGGLNDLLAAVESGRVTRVICERSDRAARDMLAILTVEYTMEKCGVELIYATEPPNEHSGTMSASRLRMRRSEQMDAEIYRARMLENSGRGQREHAMQGYSHGCAPYPYVSIIDPDAPVPNDRFLRRAKRRLDRHPDSRRWDAVELMARMRINERADYRDITAALNADADRYPYDRPGGTWSVRRVRKLLLNPRLTGYAVFNRRSNLNGYKTNPIEDWTWSRKPAHPAAFTVHDWAEMMRMESTSCADDAPIQQIYAAAAKRGITVEIVRSNEDHCVYAVDERRFTVPNPVPQAAADHILSWMETA